MEKLAVASAVAAGFAVVPGVVSAQGTVVA